MKHSTVSPSPFVPFGKVWKGLAQAAWAAFDGENVGIVAELEVDVLEIVELEDKKLDTPRIIDELGDANKWEDEETEGVNIKVELDSVNVDIDFTLLEAVV